MTSHHLHHWLSLYLIQAMNFFFRECPSLKKQKVMGGIVLFIRYSHCTPSRFKLCTISCWFILSIIYLFPFSVQSLGHHLLFCSSWIAGMTELQMSAANSGVHSDSTSTELVMPLLISSYVNSVLLLFLIHLDNKAFQIGQHSAWGGQKYWSFCFSIISSRGTPGLISLWEWTG